MPLYEYYCPKCQSKFELLVSHRHADDVVCMKCRHEKVRRLLSVFAAPRSNGSDAAFDDGSLDEDSGGGCCGGACGCN